MTILLWMRFLLLGALTVATVLAVWATLTGRE